MKQSETFTTLLPESLSGLRLDQALSQVFPEISRNKIQKLIKNGELTVNGEKAKAKATINGGEEIHFVIDVEEDLILVPEAIPLNILYEDEALIIINKPAGLVVHPGAGNTNSTLANALVHYCPELLTLERAGIVHRLDKDTSGILLIAKTEEAEEDLEAQFAERSVTRIYHALVFGEIISGMTINAPIGRNLRQRKKMMVTAYDEELEENPGREAITHIRILEKFRSHTLIECYLETGRTHQIRVHLQHINHPVIGDPEYGGRLRIPKKCHPHAENLLRSFRRQALHAHTIGFIHPISGMEMTFSCPIPNDFASLIKAIREDTQQYEV